MKKIFVYFSILIIASLAYFDAKDRFEELDNVAANTPSQVETKQMINRPETVEKMLQPAQNRMNETSNEANDENKNFRPEPMNKYQQNQLDNVDRRRNTIHNPVN